MEHLSILSARLTEDEYVLLVPTFLYICAATIR